MKGALSTKLLAVSRNFIAYGLQLIAGVISILLFICIGLLGWVLNWDRYEFHEHNRDKFYE